MTHWKHWTIEEDITIVQLRDQGKTIPEISEIMDRTPNAVKRRFHKIGYWKKPLWTKTEDETVIRMRREGCTYQEISDVLPRRGVKAVGHRCRALGLCKPTAFKIIAQWAEHNKIKMEG